MKINKKWAISLVEMIIVTVIMSFILVSLYTITIDAYSKFNSFRAKNFLLEESNKIQRNLASIRFAKDIVYLDQSPINHPELSEISFLLPNDDTFQIIPFDEGENTDSLTFIDTEWNEIYVYNKDLIDIKKFTITEMDQNINRWWVRINMLLSINWNENELAARRFWNIDYEQEYNIVYTFRNNSNSD